MKKEFYVYAHYTEDTKELFYLGKGKNNRINDTTNRNDYWKKIVNKHGIHRVKIYENLLETDAFYIEKRLIYNFKKINLCRANFHVGGLGGDTFTYLPESKKIEIKSKIKKGISNMSDDTLESLIKKRRLNNLGSNNPMYGKISPKKGKHLPEETKNKIRNSVLNSEKVKKNLENLFQLNRKKVKLINKKTGEVSIFNSITEAEKEINSNHISEVCKGKYKSTKGFYAKYI